jgi:hypothetical protein
MGSAQFKAAASSLDHFNFHGFSRSDGEAAAKAEPLLWISPSFFEIAEYHFFSVLSQTAIFSTSNQDEQQHAITRR